MKREDAIKQMLKARSVNSIDKLNDDDVLALYDFINFHAEGSASQIYEESETDERYDFISIIRDCLNNKKNIVIYSVRFEGVRDATTEQYYDWCSKHTCWYQVI